MGQLEIPHRWDRHPHPFSIDDSSFCHFGWLIMTHLLAQSEPGTQPGQGQLKAKVKLLNVH
jgi:hypothetical protein